MSIIKHLCQQHQLKQRIADNRSRLFRMAYAWGHNADLANDLAQEAMAKALKNLSQLREPEALDSWLFGILANCWRDHFRRQREHVDIEDVTLTDEATPERLHQRQDIIDLVRGAVAHLVEGQRHVLTLVDLEGFSYTEVANILGIPVGTVMSRLSRARSQLAGIVLAQHGARDDKGNTRLRSVT